MTLATHQVVTPKLRSFLKERLPTTGAACVFCGEKTQNPAVWLARPTESGIVFEVCCWICSLERSPETLVREARQEIAQRLIPPLQVEDEKEWNLLSLHDLSAYHVEG